MIHSLTGPTLAGDYGAAIQAPVDIANRRTIGIGKISDKTYSINSLPAAPAARPPCQVWQRLHERNRQARRSGALAALPAFALANFRLGADRERNGQDKIYLVTSPVLTVQARAAVKVKTSDTAAGESHANRI